MRIPRTILNPLVAASLAIVSGMPLRAETDGLERQFRELADPDYAGWQRAESDIEMAWSRSGSPAMDLLLKRGEQALDGGDAEAAVEHLTALTDHAPDFPEGWNARANAWLAAGEFGPAIADLRRALILEPRHWGALATLGQVFEEMDQPDRALAAYRASFGLNPHQDAVKDAIARLEKELAGVAL